MPGLGADSASGAPPEATSNGATGGSRGAAGNGAGDMANGELPADVPAPRLAGPLPPPPGQQEAPTGRADQHRLPPGQYVQASMPVLHYGPVPACNPQSWDMRVYGATEDGRDRRWTWDGFRSLPRIEIIADFHCVTKFSVLGVTWLGVPAADVLRAVPASARATHVMVWAEFGYGANLPLDVFGAPDTLFATHREGKELTAEQGYPVRLVVPSRYGWKNVKWVRAIEYMIGDRRGFWEERGYHNNADPWREQRYSYQELPGEGPEL